MALKNPIFFQPPTGQTGYGYPFFFWSEYEKVADAVRLPFKLDAAGAADFASRWLAELDYGKQPDHDGDNEKGWRVYCEGWGHVDGNHSAFLAVAPAWAMYGK